MKVTRMEKVEFMTLKLIWVSCPYPAVTLELEKMLEAKFRVFDGQERPVDEAPSTIILCPKGEDVGSEEVRYLRAQAPDVPVLVLGLRLDTQGARAALLAGADGFIYLGMQPAQIIYALSAALKGETLVPRDLLQAFLVEKESQVDTVLTPRQREFLELVAVSASSGREIMVPRELLKAFVREAPVT
jgi:DNA-binding NarL/FixJ family response regulator